jgi:hypothetical protein
MLHRQKKIEHVPLANFFWNWYGCYPFKSFPNVILLVFCMCLYKITILLRKGTRILNFRIYLDGIHKICSFSYVILMRSITHWFIIMYHNRFCIRNIWYSVLYSGRNRFTGGGIVVRSYILWSRVKHIQRWGKALLHSRHHLLNVQIIWLIVG